MFGRGAPRQSSRQGAGSALKMRILIALAIAAFAVISYYAKPGDRNEVTGESQRVAMTEEADEVQLGLQAAPEMVGQHGGPSRDVAGQQLVNTIGWRLLEALEDDLAAYSREHPDDPRHNPYHQAFRFTLLADPQTVNAFALPGGQVFITQALFDQLPTEGSLAGVLGHEIGHVLARHGNQRMAKQGLFQGLAGAIGVLGGDVNSARMAQMVTAAISMKYGRDQELESDDWGVRLMGQAGYDPRSMITVMEVLKKATGGGGGPPEFMSTHPSPENREEKIEEAIAKYYPNGIPAGLRP
ncbi:MAG: M48 family metallopeptidase [Planctomycetales bacterium]|nr:M48 family metallopeptidase [Planctomycetales bacterium]